jgi:hypothetical protein
MASEKGVTLALQYGYTPVMTLYDNEAPNYLKSMGQRNLTGVKSGSNR